jgi:quercetin dioxygenase-like cupin family protein
VRTPEVIADTADRRVEILCETDAMHATRTRLGPRRAGTDPHVHREHNDVFYVLEGELTVRLGADGEMAATPGTMVVVPPLVVHAYRNASDADVVFLNVHAPGSRFAAYLRALRDGARHHFDQHPPPEDGGRPASDATVVRGMTGSPGIH